MGVNVRAFASSDIDAMCEIWNTIVEEGIAFPQEESLTPETARLFFGEQSRTAVAERDGEILGLYILHPNNIGRCGHISNASYAVKKGLRGQHIGEALVRDSMESAKQLGFSLLQFNAVVATNHGAIHLYEKLGFVRLGTIPGGFRLKDGSFVDIHPYYATL